MKIHRKILIGLLLICLLLFLISSPSVAQTPQKISLQYSYNTPAVAADGITPVSIPGLNNMVFIEAELPVQSLQILLPYGTTVDMCNVTYSKETVISGVSLPDPPMYATISDPSITMQAGSQSANTHYSQGTMQYLRGFAFYTINLYPVTYQGTTLRYVNSISLDITLKTTDKATYDEAEYVPTVVDTDFLPEDYACPENLNGYLQNKPIITADNTTLAGTGIVDYIIITKQDFVTAFNPLLTFKRNKGLTAKTVTVESIYSSYAGRDKPEKIRNFIKAALKKNRVKYILLGGDADANSTNPKSIVYNAIVPTRILYCSGVSPYYIASDLYYSCLGGNYDYDKDKVFGEKTDGVNGGDVDLLPDVYVGRAPVSSVAQVKSFVSKTIAYENRSKLKKALMVGEYMGYYSYNYLYGKDWKEEIRKGSTKLFTSKAIPSTYTVKTLYDKDRSSNWTKTTLISLLNQNLELVNHMGHANNTYVMRLQPSDLQSLTNTRSFFIFSHGCFSGAFDNMSVNSSGSLYYTTSDAMSEQMITVNSRAGAVATVMNSRYGWFAYYSYGYGPYTPYGTQLFDRSLFNKFIRAPRTSIGSLLGKSKVALYSLGQISDSCNRYCYFEINLMGDPEMSLTTKIATLGGNYTAADERNYVLDLTTVDATTNPQTGDAFPLSVLLIILAISLSGLTFLLVNAKIWRRTHE